MAQLYYNLKKKKMDCRKFQAKVKEKGTARGLNLGRSASLSHLVLDWNRFWLYKSIKHLNLFDRSTC